MNGVVSFLLVNVSALGIYFGEMEECYGLMEQHIGLFFLILNCISRYMN